MTMLSPHRFSASPLRRPPPYSRHHSSARLFAPVVRSSLPFPPEKARYHGELEAAVDAVERACRLCVDVKKSLLSSDERILEKKDQTPVTIADFGVQALISLELSRSFPLIPLVAEEDSAFLRSSNFLVDSVLDAVTDQASPKDEPLTSDDVLVAIDRGGKDAFTFDTKPATYWVLDPIDGTRGFLKGNDALYVVGLALVVEGEVAIGVMGCPNWKENSLPTNNQIVESEEKRIGAPEHGIVMIAHVGCGTWSRKFSDTSKDIARTYDGWMRCFVNSCSLVHEAYFCISDSQTWESLPLSSLYSLTNDASCVKDEKQVILLQTCCGSLCKYLMVASGRASVFILRAKVQTAIKAWDHAIGIICVHEAVGQVTDWRGDPLDLAADQVERRIIFPSGGVLVTNGNIHKQIVDMISSNSSVV